MKFSKMAIVVLALLLAGCGQNQENGTASEAESPGSGDRSPAPETTVETPETGPVIIQTSNDGNVRVRAEIADDMNEMAIGLMERTALAEDSGMLFVYPEEREMSFWMKNTLIPLSIAFMDSEGRIVDIQDMKPLDDTPPHYVSAQPAQYALEVNKGFFDERRVEVGDKAKLPV